jgi:hypothetical protein
LKPGDIVIMDNLGSHKGKALCRLIRSAGAKLLFLPTCATPPHAPSRATNYFKNAGYASA